MLKAQFIQTCIK